MRNLLIFKGCLQRKAYFCLLRPVLRRCISGLFAAFASVRNVLGKQMLLRRASVPIWEGFGGPCGGFGSSPIPKFKLLFRLSCQVGPLRPSRHPSWTLSELIFDTFLMLHGVFWSFQLRSCCVLLSLLSPIGVSVGCLFLSASEMLSCKRKLVSIAFFHPWTCTVGSPLVSTCGLRLLRVQYSKRVLC